MNSKRPINLNILTIKLPLSAYVSILHRMSGILLFIGVGFLLYILDLSLSSAQSFAELQACMLDGVVRFFVWLLLAGLIYHFVAGVKHLLIETGIGEDKKSGKIATVLTIIVSVVLIVLAGVWV